MIWFLHGAVGQAGDWDEVSQSLAKGGVKNRSVDLWRFLECEGMSLEEWARSFNAEVKAAGEEQNIIVGYSMGGRLALHALMADPELWDRAVIISAHPGLQDEHERLDRMAQDAEWAAKALAAEWPRFIELWEGQAVLQQAGEEEENTACDERRGRLVNRRRAIARSFMEWSLGKQQDLRPRLAEVACPVLWLAGERDDKFVALAKESVALLVKGDLQILPAAGHRLPFERTEDFQSSLKCFCEEDL